MILTIILQALDTSNFWVVNWYYIVAILLSLTGVVFGIKNYFKRGKANEKSSNIKISPQINPTNTNTNTNSVTINVGKIDQEILQKESTSKTKDDKLEKLKRVTKILFIDDDKKFNVVKILKDSGWKNTKSVTDIKSLDIPVVDCADIVFVDINGVGKLLNCEYEGLDIALMLKQKYPAKKVVIYSANKNNNSFHKAWDKCDFKLEKNALPYQFQNLVEQYSFDLYPLN